MRMRWILSLLFASLCCFSTVSLSGCGAVHKVAKKVGVKAKTVKIKLADLGSGYSSLSDTKWDCFSTKSNTPQVKLSYKKVGISSIDDFNTSANLLYGQYVFADKMLDKTLIGLTEIFNLKLDKKAYNEIIKAIQKRDINQISKVRELKDIKTNVTFAVKSTAGLAGRAADMVSKGKALYDKVPAQVQADPRRVLLADIALSEVKSSISRCSSVVKGAPDLVKKLTKIADVLSSVMKYI